METQLPANILSCTQCGGELHPDEGQIFITCPFCSSTVYIDKARVVFHWYVAPTLDAAQAQAALRRWMTGSHTVKDLDDKSEIGAPAFEYFPLWVFKLRGQDGREEIRLVPAAATAVSEITHLNLPAGDLRKYNQDIEAQSLAPSVPLQAAREWTQTAPGNAPTEQSLVHVPIYTFKYTYRGAAYTALVEGATGSVFANLYPAKSEARYLTAGLLTALVYLCLALVPVGMGLVDGGEGGALGMAICTGLGLAAAPLLFGFAAWVAAKV
jgi:predicted RNA-binding Zn-ribbon protein involved in translation (DUF1610 family)